jgi:hypothetical protein
MKCRHDLGLDTLLLLPVMHLLNARASLVLGHTWAADHLSLSLPHASVDVDVLDSNPHWAVRRNREPAVDLPDQVQDNEERRRHVEFEKGLDLEIRAADWVKRDVELGDERNGVDGEADPGAPNAERGSVWDFVKRVAVQGPRK